MTLHDVTHRYQVFVQLAYTASTPSSLLVMQSGCIMLVTSSAVFLLVGTKCYWAITDHAPSKVRPRG